MKWFMGSVLLMLLPLPGVGWATELPDWEVGLRGGMEATGSDEQYQVGEFYLLRKLPWRADTALGPILTRLDLGAGYLEGADDHEGFLVGVGGDLVWLPGNGPVELEVGFRPAWLSDDVYDEDDYGGDLQFLSHVGVSLRLCRFVVSYRYEHMSNAGLYNENDGLNLHLFGLGVRF